MNELLTIPNKLTLPPLPDNCILLVEVGSTAHGTGLPGGEDLDLTGVALNGSGGTPFTFTVDVQAGPPASIGVTFSTPVAN